MPKKEASGRRFSGGVTRGESFEGALTNLYEAIEECLSVEVDPTSIATGARVVEIAVLVVSGIGSPVFWTLVAGSYTQVPVTIASLSFSLTWCANCAPGTTAWRVCSGRNARKTSRQSATRRRRAGSPSSILAALSGLRVRLCGARA